METLDTTVEIWNGELSHATIDLDTWLHYETETDDMSQALLATYQEWSESRNRGWVKEARPEDFLKRFGKALGMGNEEHGCWNGFTGNSDNDFSDDFSFEIWHMEDYGEYYVFLQRGMYAYADLEVYRVIDPDYFYNWQVELWCRECQGNPYESTWDYNCQWERELEKRPSLPGLSDYWKKMNGNEKSIAQDKLQRLDVLHNSHRVEIETDGKWEAYNDEKHEHEYAAEVVRFRCHKCLEMSVMAYSQTGI